MFTTFIFSLCAMQITYGGRIIIIKPSIYNFIKSTTVGREKLVCASSLLHVSISASSNSQRIIINIVS